MPLPFEQQPKESHKAFAAFRLYLSLGPQRSLEEVGRKLDEELGRLRRFVEEDLAPKTEERTAQFLREVSEKLTDAASWLDERRASRDTAPNANCP